MILDPCASSNLRRLFNIMYVVTGENIKTNNQSGIKCASHESFKYDLKNGWP